MIIAFSYAPKPDPAFIGHVAELAETHVICLLDAEVVSQVEVLREETNAQMRKSVAKVIAEFDTLSDLILGKKAVADGRQEHSIPELLQDPATLAHAQHNARKAGRLARGVQR